MGKIGLFGLICLSSFLLCGCGANEDVREGEDGVLYSREAVYTGAILDEDLPFVEEGTLAQEDCVVFYTDEKKESLNKFLSGCTHVRFRQVKSNSVALGSSNNMITYDGDLDLKNNIVICSVSGMSGGKVDFAYSDDVYRIRDGSGWVDSERKFWFNWDLATCDNILDVFDLVVQGYEIGTGYEGVCLDGSEVYTLTGEASSGMLTGIDYDRLGDYIVSYRFSSVDKNYIPVEVAVTVEYFVGETEYICALDFTFVDISDEELSLPWD